MALYWLLVLLCSPLWISEGVEGWGGLSTVPSESECRPYIEKALKEHTPQEAVDTTGSDHTTTPSQSDDQEGSIEETEEATTKESTEGDTDNAAQSGDGESKESAEAHSTEEDPKEEKEAESEDVPQADEPVESVESTETQDSTLEEKKDEESKETEEVKEETPADQPSLEDGHESAEDTNNENAEKTPSEDSTEDASAVEEQSAETPEESATDDKSIEEETKSGEENVEETPESTEQEGETEPKFGEVTDEPKAEEKSEEGETAEEVSGEEKPEESQEPTDESAEKDEASEETVTSTEDHTVEESVEIPGEEITNSAETTESLEATESAEAGEAEEPKDSTETTDTSGEETTLAPSEEAAEVSTEETKEVVDSKETSDEQPTESTEASGETSSEKSDAETTEPVTESTEEKETAAEPEVSSETSETIIPTEGAQTTSTEESGEQEPVTEEEEIKEPEPTVEDQLTLEFDIPKVRRPRDHITEILRLSPESVETELLVVKTIESTLKELKKHYDAAIQPLEILYKYRDLSNRHFGDPEIFSKPLILFMGPWSGGKSTILNYLLDNEFKTSSLRTGAEPSPAYFNIVMWGDKEEVLDGTQLAADWTFSGLQKFGQGLLDRLRGLRLNNPLLEKVNIVEIPGILEIRKQVERLFPFNDACQWFIDRADIIFLVYDPSKLDVGPETEAILDQLKGREYQTRIILNKADQVKPEELMRVQGTLIWNISPLMSSQEPPVMYSTSLWSIPYEQGSPSRLLHAQERAFLRDLRLAIDKRVENKIASARRFAVRVRNHAKMVDCYLTTYYNHKTFFGNRKKVADDIIEHPQNYHIYEGLSTLTNISRYDLPDPEVYRDFFRLNALYDFQRLSDTCTYFRGCPINRLDRAIAYDLPELVGKYKKQAEKVLETVEKEANKS